VGGTATLHKRRNHERRTSTPDEISKIVSQAGRVLEACGIVRSPSWLSRTVRSYMRHAAPKGLTFGAWLVTQVQLGEEHRRRVLSDPELRYVLVYSDPTGESAVRNAMRAR